MSGTFGGKMSAWADGYRAGIAAAPAQPEGWREAARTILAAMPNEATPTSSDWNIAANKIAGRSMWSTDGGMEALRDALRVLAEPPAPPAPVEREETRFVWMNGKGPSIASRGARRESHHSHLLRIRWQEVDGAKVPGSETAVLEPLAGATRGAVTGEWEMIGGDRHDD